MADTYTCTRTHRKTHTKAHAQKDTHIKIDGEVAKWFRLGYERLWINPPTVTSNKTGESGHRAAVSDYAVSRLAILN